MIYFFFMFLVDLRDKKLFFSYKEMGSTCSLNNRKEQLGAKQEENRQTH